DRIVAVEQDAHSWENVKTIDDLGKQFAQELEEFFVNYHKVSGKQYRVLGLKGAGSSTEIGEIRDAVRIPRLMNQMLIRFLGGVPSFRHSPRRRCATVLVWVIRKAA